MFPHAAGPAPHDEVNAPPLLHRHGLVVAAQVEFEKAHFEARINVQGYGFETSRFRAMGQQSSTCTAPPRGSAPRGAAAPSPRGGSEGTATGAPWRSVNRLSKQTPNPKSVSTKAKYLLEKRGDFNTLQSRVRRRLLTLS